MRDFGSVQYAHQTNEPTAVLARPAVARTLTLGWLTAGTLIPVDMTQVSIDANERVEILLNALCFCPGSSVWLACASIALHPLAPKLT